MSTRSRAPSDPASSSRHEHAAVRPPSDLFSDGLVYRFRLRPLTPRAASDPAPFTVADEEFVFDSVFSDPTGDEGSVGRRARAHAEQARRSPSA